MRHSLFTLFLCSVLACGFIFPAPVKATELKRLTINIEPQAAVDLGAKWRVSDSSNWRESGSSMFVETGTEITVVFSYKPGNYARPTDKTYILTHSIVDTQYYDDYPQEWDFVLGGKISGITYDFTKPEFFTEYLYIPPFEGTASLKILPKRGVTPEGNFPAIHVAGDLSTLISHASTPEIRVTKGLKNLNMVNSYATEVRVFNLGNVRMMNKTPCGVNDFNTEPFTYIYSGIETSLFTGSISEGMLDDWETLAEQSGKTTSSIDPMFYNLNINLAGVSLRNLNTTRQIVNVSTSPKKFVHIQKGKDSDYRITDVSTGRIFTEAHGSFVAGSFRNVTARGGIDNTIAKSEAIGNYGLFSLDPGTRTKVLSRSMKVRLKVQRLADRIVIMDEICTLDGSTIIANSYINSLYSTLTSVNGDLRMGDLVTAGAIPLLRATRGLAYFGSVKTGTNQIYPVPIIGKIIGDYGVGGKFYAGEGTRIAWINLIQTNPGYQIQGKAYVSKPVRRFRGHLDPVGDGTFEVFLPLHDPVGIAEDLFPPQLAD